MLAEPKQVTRLGPDGLDAWRHFHRLLIWYRLKTFDDRLGVGGV